MRGANLWICTSHALCSRFVCVDRLTDPLQTFSQNGLGTGQIQTDKSIRVLYEHVAALKQDAGLVGKERGKVLVRSEVCVQIYPGELRCLGLTVLGQRKMLGEVFSGKTEVLI